MNIIEEIQKIKCFFGFHDFFYSDYYSQAVGKHFIFSTCKFCGNKKQLGVLNAEEPEKKRWGSFILDMNKSPELLKLLRGENS